MAKTLIDTDTATGTDATLGFTSGIDSTYKVYEFHFVNMHTVNNQVDFTVQFNASGGSGFDEVIQSTTFQSQHGEGDGGGTVGYYSAYDQGQGTAYQALNYETGYDADQSVSGILTLYDPSDPTFVKHFLIRLNRTQKDEYHMDTHVAGYINTTSAIDEIDFKFSGGEIQGGEIKMYGIAKS